tara:strand:- start:22 stop:393 length:372 start_codon:yes stop_codon:yes gene_type:complete
MWTNWVAFFHEAVADFTSKHVLIGFFFTDFLCFSILRAEHGDVARQIESFQSKFRLNSMLKGLREVFRGVQNTAVVNVGDVHIEHIIGQLCLGCLNSNASLSGDATNGNLRYATQKSFTRRIV